MLQVGFETFKCGNFRQSLTLIIYLFYLICHLVFLNIVSLDNLDTNNNIGMNK